MVERFDQPRDLDWKPLPMRPDIAGQYVRYSDLAKARAENERLTKERDEARAKVKVSLQLAVNAVWDIQPQTCTANVAGTIGRAIRALTPADAQTALEAYGREKVREGMQRAADIALCHSDDRPRRYSMDWNDGYIDGCKGASDAILAEMEKLK